MQADDTHLRRPTRYLRIQNLYPSNQTDCYDQL